MQHLAHKLALLRAQSMGFHVERVVVAGSTLGVGEHVLRPHHPLAVAHREG